MTIINIDTTSLAPAWNSLQSAFPFKISPIRDKTHYEQMVVLMNALIDTVRDETEHELADFLDLIGQLVEDYDNAHHVIPDASPSEVLRFIMDLHGLMQSDLASELGGQPVVSNILHGKRAMNARQAKALAARFGVSPSVFL